MTDAEWAAHRADVVFDVHRADVVFYAHRDDPDFGHRLLADQARDTGRAMADRTAWRICRDNQRWSCFGKKRRGGRRLWKPRLHGQLTDLLPAHPQGLPELGRAQRLPAIVSDDGTRPSD